jgi:4-amino-4-deoxy-L-arabinose transferase-like glycosyltransferase
MEITTHLRAAHPKNWPAIAWVLALTIVHGSLYAVIVPPWQVPDENVHYEYLRDLALTRSLVPFTVDRPAAVFQQVRESMGLYRWYEFLRLPTPVVTPAAPYPSVVARGGWSLYYRLSLPLYTLVRAWPIVNQLYLLRLYSVALQCLTVWLTYKLATLIFSNDSSPIAWLIPAAAAFVVAMVPQYTFISAGYNDDNLVPPLVAGSLYAALRGLSRQGDIRWLWLAGAQTVLAILTKRTAIGLAVLLAVCLVAYSFVWLRSTSMIKRAMGVGVVVGAVVGALALAYLIIDPPQLPTRLAAIAQVSPDAWVTLAGYGREPARLLKIDWVGPLVFLSVSFWGWFGWLRVPLDNHLLELLRRVTLVIIAGCGLGWVRLASAARRLPQLRFQAGALLLLGLGLVLGVVVLFAQFLLDPTNYPPTGRYLFPFISAFGILAVWGWQAWWPARWKARGVLLGLAMLTVVDFVAMALTMIPYFYT